MSTIEEPNPGLKSVKLFGKKPMSSWGSDLTGIDIQNIPTVRGGAAL